MPQIHTAIMSRACSPPMEAMTLGVRSSWSSIPRAVNAREYEYSTLYEYVQSPGYLRYEYMKSHLDDKPSTV